MYNVEFMLSKIRERPFVPFRLITSSGQVYDITHPELLMVGKSRLVIGSGSNEYPGAFESTSIIAMLHITDMQELGMPAQTGIKGKAGA